MKRSPEFLLAIIIVVLIIAGIIVYVVTAQHAGAPTTATSTPTSTTTTSSQSVVTPPASGNTTYTDPGNTFTFTYPSQFTLSGGTGSYDQDWMVNSNDDGLLLVKVAIPGSFEPKTNFVDANFTVGTSPKPGAVSSCLAAPASGSSVQKSVVTINGVTFTKYVSSDAGAGNLYTTTSYRTLYMGQCYAVEYTIHSSNIGNYPSSSGVTQFDQTKIENVLQEMVRSFKFLS